MLKFNFEKNCERMFLKEEKGYELIQSTNALLDTTVQHQRIKEFIEKSKIRTIIREEAVNLTQFLRGDKEKYRHTTNFHSTNLFQRLKEG